MPMNKFDKMWKDAKSIVARGGSDNRVAGVLDVSRQALAVWEADRNIPILRALQVEKITDGKYTWRQLSPKTAEVVDSVLQFYP
jgi:hypothetical protein